MITWTPEKITALTLDQLKGLTANARRYEDAALLVMCEAELEARKPKPKKFFGASDGFVRVSRSSSARQLEKRLDALLVEVAVELEAKYDLSAEKALELSCGTQRFKPHRLLSAKGVSKVGGAQRAGRVVFDRYISYRIKDYLLALVAFLAETTDLSKVRFQVIGPPELLRNAMHISDIRTYLAAGETIGLTEFAEEFDNLELAVERFSYLIDQLAPRLSR